MKNHQIFLVALLCFIAGIGLASFAHIDNLILIFGIIISVVLLIIGYGKKSAFWAGIFILAFICGMYRFQIKAQLPIIPIEEGRQIQAEFSGIVSGYPDERLDKTYLVLSGLEFSGQITDPDIKIRISTSRYPQYRYGDKLFVQGKISRPENFDDFDYKNYLAKNNIYLVSSYPKTKLLEHNQGNWLKQKLFAVRATFSEALRSSIKEPQAAFAEGLLLGSVSRLPNEFQDNFRTVGLSHVVALSGFNITIVAGFLIAVFSWFTLKRELNFWLATAGIVSFVVLTGAEASAVRAAVMGLLVLIAQREGRIYNIKNALAFAAAAMIWFNPKLLRFDVGFQLSFLATLGLVYLAPRLENLMERIPKVWTLKEYFVSTVSAQFAVLPILVGQFGTVSIMAPLANLLVLPFIPAIMLLSFLAAVLYLVYPLLGNIAAVPAEIFLKMPLQISNAMSSWPFASISVSFGIILAILYLTALYLWFKIKPLA